MAPKRDRSLPVAEALLALAPQHLPSIRQAQPLRTT